MASLSVSRTILYSALQFQRCLNEMLCSFFFFFFFISGVPSVTPSVTYGSGVLVMLQRKEFPDTDTGG